MVRAGLFLFALGLAAVFGLVAVRATGQAVSWTADAAQKRSLLQAALGAWLKAVGIVGLYVSQAARFQDWSTFGLPFAPARGRFGPRGGLRQAQRQIGGREPYGPQDVERLRSLAQYRVDMRRSNATVLARSGSISLLLFFVGIALAPPSEGDYGTPFARVFQALAIVMIIGLVAGLLLSRKRVDKEAEAFLARTADSSYS